MIRCYYNLFEVYMLRLLQICVCTIKSSSLCDLSFYQYIDCFVVLLETYTTVPRKNNGTDLLFQCPSPVLVEV